MSIATVTQITPTSVTDEFDGRARWCRAGIVNVHRYANTTFEITDGRLVLLGTNGSGKSRGMDMLFPFVISGDRRRMGSGTSGQVSIESLMKKMIGAASNRVGYVWAECAMPDGTHLTVGAYFKYSTATKTSTVEYFITQLRVGIDLPLTEDGYPLRRDRLTELVGAHRITRSATTHREKVARDLYGVTDSRSMDRFRAYLDLLYKLRAPDIGVRVNGGELTQILSESLPPLSDALLTQAGGHLDGLQDIRTEQQRLERQSDRIEAALQVYSGYAVAVLEDAAKASETADTADGRVRGEEEQARAALNLATEALKEAEEKHDAARAVAVEAQSRISAIEKSPAYKDHIALNDKSGTVAALTDAANTALTGWSNQRIALDRLTETANAVAGEIESRGTTVAEKLARLREVAGSAGLPTDVPDVRVIVTPASDTSRTVRMLADAHEIPESAPAISTVAVAPDPVSAAADNVAKLRTAAAEKQQAAFARREGADRLRDESGKVDELERTAEAAADRTAAATAKANDDAVAAAAARESLASRWVAWVNDIWVRQALDGVDWGSTVIGSFLDGNLEPFPDLDLLDRTAFAAAEPARERISGRVAALDVEAATLAARESEFSDDLGRLNEPGQVVTPDRSSWVEPSNGTPFWRAVDFLPNVDDGIRAAVESALEASGMLTAVVDETGSLVADGAHIITGDGPVASSPISSVLVSEPDVDVCGILERIGFNDSSHASNVNEDGSFRLGQTLGKPATRASRFIGLVAQERARAARMEELQNLIAETRTQLAGVRRQLNAAREDRKRITKLVAEAPTAGGVRNADAIAEASAGEASTRRGEQAQAADVAVKARLNWDQKVQTHRNQCATAGLPWTYEELDATHRATEMTAAAAGETLSRIEDLGREVNRFRDAEERHRHAEAETVDVAIYASKKREAWLEAAAELNQLMKSVGAEAASVKADHDAATARLIEANIVIDQQRQAIPDLSRTAGKKESDLGSAETAAAAAAERATEALVRLRSICQLPGVLASATGTQDSAHGADATPHWVRSLIANRPKKKVDDVHKALDVLITDLSSDFEVIRHTHDLGVVIVELVDADGGHSLAAIASTLNERAVIGKAALGKEEHDRFQRYIMDSVGEELRQSILLAQETIRATSDRVSQHRTSNNIGVKLRITPNDALGTELTRIRELILIAGPVRTEQQTAELTRLLRDVVDQEYSDNPGSGYEAALSKAFDYRNWYTVEAVILGPEQNRERGLRGAQLSSGELRYISYLTLTCAIDSQMSALAAVAPRLLLMDDAFAMVDVTGRRHLVQIIVERDIDFIMTGHDLWLTYPEAPGVDLYEIHTHGEENPASAIHYRWDGHSRTIQLR